MVWDDKHLWLPDTFAKSFICFELCFKFLISVGRAPLTDAFVIIGDGSRKVFLGQSHNLEMVPRYLLTWQFGFILRLDRFCVVDPVPCVIHDVCSVGDCGWTRGVVWRGVAWRGWWVGEGVRLN